MSVKIISRWYIYELMQARQSFDTPTPDTIHRYMCNNPKLPSPYVNGWESFRLYDGSHLKTYQLMRW